MRTEDYEVLRRCLSGLQVLARSLDGLQLDRRQATPDRTVNLHFSEFKERLGERASAALSGDVVGPDAWFYVARRHQELLAAHPTLVEEYSELLSDLELVEILRERRSDLRRYMEAIRNELTAFQAEERETVFFRHSGRGEEAEQIFC